MSIDQIFLAESNGLFFRPIWNCHHGAGGLVQQGQGGVHHVVGKFYLINNVQV